VRRLQQTWEGTHGVDPWCSVEDTCRLVVGAQANATQVGGGSLQPSSTRTVNSNDESAGVQQSDAAVTVLARQSTRWHGPIGVSRGPQAPAHHQPGRHGSRTVTGTSLDSNWCRLIRQPCRNSWCNSAGTAVRTLTRRGRPATQLEISCQTIHPLVPSGVCQQPPTRCAPAPRPAGRTASRWSKPPVAAKRATLRRVQSLVQDPDCPSPSKQPPWRTVADGK